MTKLRAYELQDQGMDTVEAKRIAGFLGGRARLRFLRRKS